jgi:Helix-turn-helix domain
VGIGGALAEARSEAGLTVDQVSERTRIRATIVRAIERDDYAVCGGDYYARGHIRAIARVVGTDPAPLIEQYDIAHSPPLPPADDPGPHRSSGAWLHTLDGEPDRGSHPVANGAAPAVTPAANGHDGNARVRPGGITAAEAFRPVMPLQLQGTRRLPVRRVLLTLIVLAVIAVVAYLLTAGGTAPAPARSHHPPARRAQHTTAAAPRASPTTAAPSAAPTALPISSSVAFGPAGPSQGDNPSEAALAVDGSASTAWHTDWYAAADLNGQPGTGLLLDMGTSVAVSSVQVLLGPAPGGTVQLRAGNTPSLADLPVVAQATNPGGTLTLQAGSQVRARYLLVWFTQLPPDNAGAYEAYVYNVSVSGTA